MSTEDTKAAQDNLEKRLDSAYQRLSAAIANLPREQAFKGTEWSVADCLSHVAPSSGGYSSMVESLINQEKPKAPAFSPDARWAGLKEALTKEYHHCRSIIHTASGDKWGKAVALADGSTRPVSEFVERMVAHFEDHANQISTQIVPRVQPKG